MSTIAGGEAHSLFIDTAGIINCCGANGNGQLGFGDQSARKNIQKVTSMPPIISVACSQHSLLLDQGGSVWACGQNLFNQCTPEKKDFVLSPVQIPLPNPVLSISASHKLSTCVDDQGQVWQFGIKQKVPQILKDLPPISAYAQMNDTTGFALDRNRQVHKIEYGVQSIIENIPPITTILASQNALLMLDASKNVWVCGNGKELRLVEENKTNPVRVENLPPIKAVSIGYRYALFLDENGSVWVSGYRTNDGQLGLKGVNGTFTTVKNPHLESIAAISCGNHHSLFLDNAGDVWGCGKNDFGQLSKASWSEPNIVETPKFIIGGIRVLDAPHARAVKSARFTC